MNKNPRVTASCRIPPQLKHALEQDAQELGLTTSHYLEQLILNRHNVCPDANQELETLSDEAEDLRLKNQILERELEAQATIYVNDVAKLKEQINLLQIKKDRLARQNYLLQSLNKEVSDLESRNAILSKKVNELLHELNELKNQIPCKLDASERYQLKEYLNRLSTFYPDASMNLLLIGSVHTTIRTEKSYINIPLISQFLDQHKITQS